MLSKQQIRKSLRKKRQLLPAQVSYTAGVSVYENLKKYRPYFRAKNIACYLASDGEVSLAVTIDEIWRRKINVCLPVLSTINRSSMYFTSFQSDTILTKNQFNIYEPVSHIGQQIKPLALDIVLVPLVAFSPQGDRLGMGGGYYDRYFSFLLRSLSGRKPKLVGVAYDFQEVEFLENDKWDVPLDAVVTESQLIEMKSRK